MTVIVGLTGGIASGKTFVSSFLKKLNIPIHESDVVVRKMYERPTKLFLIFLKRSGFKDALDKKKIDKNKIRELILNNKKEKAILEKHIHREVKKDRDIFIKKNKKKHLVFLDIPLIHEKKLYSICDYVCSTIAPRKIREKRALQRKGMTKSIFELILKNQVKDTIRTKKSDYLINTSSTKSKTCLQVRATVYDILKKNK